MTDELKPCPFCGATNVVICNGSMGLIGFCRNCGTTAECGKGKYEATKKWNTRPIEDALVAELEKMKSALRNIQISIFRNAEDTLWMHPEENNETVCEFIDSILGEDNCQCIAEELDAEFAAALALAKGGNT